MGMSVVTVASGGTPVVDVTSTTKIGMRVTEATPANSKTSGVAVTKVTNYGIPVVYAPPL
jgi:hypothetical protein